VKFFGGGIVVAAGTVNLRNVTLHRNVADSDAAGGGDGGGIRRSAGEVHLFNTLVEGNLDAGAEAPDCSGTLVSHGFNLIGNTAGCAIAVADNVLNVDGFVGPLANNGGRTQTNALLAPSPAVNAGSPLVPDSGGTACEATDQRGVPRSDCDIGAYELVRCFGQPVNRVGTPAANRFTGTAADEVILLLGGNDRASGGGGNDRICGGGGRDALAGGAGNDRLGGQDGIDTLNGGPGSDLCVGGPGADSAVGCERRQTI
jgi:Ca2+-binding RTX toxin-like protein